MATLQNNIHPWLSFVWDVLAQDALAQTVVNPERKARLRQDARRYQPRDFLADRVELKEHIDYCKTADGYVYVENFQRDCDNCEHKWVSKIPAYITALELHENKLFDGREGLTYCNLITEDVAKDYRASFRDRNAEYYGY